MTTSIATLITMSCALPILSLALPIVSNNTLHSMVEKLLSMFRNSPGGVRPRRGGEGRRLSTARSSFPLKLQLCTTAIRLDTEVHHGRSGSPAPCNQALHQGLESPNGPIPVPTLLQEEMPGHRLKCRMLRVLFQS